VDEPLLVPSARSGKVLLVFVPKFSGFLLRGIGRDGFLSWFREQGGAYLWSPADVMNARDDGYIVAIRERVPC
jgi:hypothetical protein